MIPNRQREQCDRLHAALTQMVPDLDRLAPNRWAQQTGGVTISFAPSDQGDGWLCVEGPSAPVADPLTLPARMKLVLDAGQRLWMRAETLLSGDEADSDAPVRRLWSRFSAARDHTAVPRDDAPAPDLARLCTEANWPFTPRAEGRLAVPLESGDVPATAIVVCDATRTIRVAVDVLQCDSLDDVSRRAMELLLGRLCDRLHLVRAGVVIKEEPITVRLEVALDAWASAAELAHAFGVLSVACRWCGRELEALIETETAHEFLAGTPAAHVPGKPTQQSADAAGKEEL